MKPRPWSASPQEACLHLAAALALSASALAGEVTYSDSAAIENRATGDRDLTTRVENGASEKRMVTVTAGGVQYNVGELGPGEKARVHVIEGPGRQPVIVFDKERP